MSKIEVSKNYQFSVSVTRGTGNTTWYAPHVHSDQVELWYIHKGPAICWCDEKAYECTDGDFFVAFPNQTHKYTGLVPHFTDKTVVQIKTKNLGYLEKVMNDFMPINPVWHCTDPTVPNLLELIYNEFENKTPERTIHTLLTAFFDKLLRNYNLKPVPHGKNKVIDVLKYCEEHFLENISLEKISKDLYISRGYVSYIFNNRLNTTLTDFINNLRIDKVIEEVTNNNLSLTDAIFAAGFNSQRTFNRAFKRIYNMTPREYLSLK